MELIQASHITKTFCIETNWLGRPTKTLTAVRDMSLTIHEGETVSLVGESGCGKSTFARTLLGLYSMSSGTVRYKGESIETQAVREAYRRHVQMIFQDPYSSLDPRMTVEDIISEPLRNYGLYTSEAERKNKVRHLLEEVDMRAEAAQRYPHEFSGGQRQRVGIARALAVSPECIFCDEPISALDVSVQVQIVTMLKRLQEERRLSYLFISHDLAMVHHMSHRIGVMYLGHLVEIGPSRDVFHEPRHPYTKTLIAAVPRPDPAYQRRQLLQGEVPSPLHLPAGCVFHTRCPYARDICRHERPAMQEAVSGHWVACHRQKGE